MSGLSLFAVLLAVMNEGLPPTREILEAIADHDAAITSFSVQLDIDSASFSDAAQIGSCVWRHTLICDRVGRYRIEGERHGNAAAPRREIQVFDGQTRREAFGERGTLSNGMIGQRAVPFFLPLDPFEIVWQYQGLATSAYLEKRGAVAIGETAWEDRPAERRRVWVLETPPINGQDGITRKAQVYVDHGRGFAVVRRAMLAHRFAAQEWVVNWMIELRNHTEAAPGIWVPTTIEHTNFYVFPDNRTSPAQHVKCRASTWSINPELDGSTFAFSFPKGVAVNDEATGNVYVAGTVNDPLIAAQVEQGRRLLGRSGGWLLVLAGVLPVAIVAVWLRARCSSTRTHPA